MNLNSVKNVSYLSKSAVVLFVAFNLCFSLPVPQTLYSSFLGDLQKDQCTLPSSISIANFQNKTVESSLQVCNSNEYLKYNKELAILCTETFDLFKSVFCPSDTKLDKLAFTFSQKVCKELEEYSVVMPEGLLKHLIDHYTCPLLCSEDVEDACQVLLSSLALTQKKSSIITEEHLSSNDPVTDQKSSIKENALDNDSGLPTSSVKQVPESIDSEPKLNDPIIKSTNDETPDSKVNPVTTPNVNEDSNKSIGNTKAEVEEYSAAKAIAEQSPITQNNKFVIPTNSSNSKTSPPVTDPQSVDPASLKLEKPQKQPSDLKNTLTPQTKNTETFSTPDQKSSPELAVQPKDKVPEEIPKKDPEPPAVLKENPEEDDTNPPTIPTVEAKEETKEVVRTSEEKTVINPKSDQPAEVSEPSLSSEPSVVSVPAQKEATVSPASPTPSLEKMEDEIPRPNEKDTDIYTDTENGDGDLDGEYSKQEYGDNRMYESSKSKETVSESSKPVIVPKEPVSERDELMDFNRNPMNPSRDVYGRSSEEIQVLATFPSQEDGHFFFYLLTIVLIFMAGYLVFHNKQKIIALIVEGRHERRRRSHGLGYRKLETK